MKSKRRNYRVEMRYFIFEVKLKLITRDNVELILRKYITKIVISSKCRQYIVCIIIY